MKAQFNETTDPFQDLTWAAKSCQNVDQFIRIIQLSDKRAEKLGLGRKGTLLGRLYDWSYSTPELERRFKWTGWFGIASEYWRDTASHLNK